MFKCYYDNWSNIWWHFNWYTTNCFSTKYNKCWYVNCLTVGNNVTLSTANPQIFLNATADGGEGSVNFKDDEGNIDGKIAYRTDYAGNTDNYMTFNTGGTEKVRIDTDANVSIRNANTTGPALSIGTTSTSVADGGFIGGIMLMLVLQTLLVQGCKHSQMEHLKVVQIFL